MIVTLYESLTEEHTTVINTENYYILFLSVLSVQDRQRRQGKDQLLLQVVDHNSSGKIEFGR